MKENRKKNWEKEKEYDWGKKVGKMKRQDFFFWGRKGKNEWREEEKGWVKGGTNEGIKIWKEKRKKTQCERKKRKGSDWGEKKKGMKREDFLKDRKDKDE